MKQKNLDTLESYLVSQRGKEAFFNAYNDDHDRLVLGLVKPELGAKPVGLIFFSCTYIAGPTRWQESELHCSMHQFKDGRVGFEISDEKAGFLLRCHGPVTIGEKDKVIPSD